MSITIRLLAPNEGGVYLDTLNRSIRGLASGHYPPDVIEKWVIPVTERAVASFQQNPDREIRLVAELDGRVVGIGALVVDKSELRACYVAPEATRQGCGSALVRELERLAKESGLTHLQLNASLNAESFYARHGYEVRERGEHTLRTGYRLAAVKMHKILR